MGCGGLLTLGKDVIGYTGMKNRLKSPRLWPLLIAIAFPMELAFRLPSLRLQLSTLLT